MQTGSPVFAQRAQLPISRIDLVDIGRVAWQGDENGKRFCVVSKCANADIAKWNVYVTLERQCLRIENPDLAMIPCVDTDHHAVT